MELNSVQSSAVGVRAVDAPPTSPDFSRPKGNEATPAPITQRSRNQEANSAVQRPDPVRSIVVQQEFPPNTRLHLDKESNRIVAQVLDDNNEVIRQIPAQELLDISARFNRLEGIIFDELS